MRNAREHGTRSFLGNRNDVLGTARRFARAKGDQTRWIFEGLGKHRREAIVRSEQRDWTGVVRNARVNGNRSVHGNRIGATRGARAIGAQSMSVFKGRAVARREAVGKGERRGRKQRLVGNARVNGNRSVDGNRSGTGASGKRHNNGCRSPKWAPKDRNRRYEPCVFDRG